MVNVTSNLQIKYDEMTHPNYHVFKIIMAVSQYNYTDNYCEGY